MTSTGIPGVFQPEKEAARLGSWRRTVRSAAAFLAELFNRPQSAAGTLIVVFFLVLAISGDIVAPYSQNDQSHPSRVPPSVEYLFGTDTAGRDVFSRVILGTESIFRVAGLGTALAVVLGTGLGLLIGYEGGLLDEIASRFIDAFLALPALLISLVLIGIIRNLELAPGTWPALLADNAILLVIAVVYVPIVARVVRSRTLEIKTQPFVEAAQIRGESSMYIIFREILPSVVPTLVVEASLRFSYAIFLVASLGFLGFGVRPPSPDWGFMVSEARGGRFMLAPWALYYPAGAISLLVIGVNLMSDGIKRVIQKSS